MTRRGALLGLVLAACVSTEEKAPGETPCTGDCSAPVCAEACDPNATCSEGASGPTCVCNEGYGGDGLLCADVDECLTDNGGCGDPTHVVCANREGAPPDCVDVDECLTGNGGCGTYHACIDNEGTPPSCVDVDECQVNNGGCGSYTCENQVGAPPSCTDPSDPNECLTDNGGCGAYAVCSNNIGAPPTCTDINECLTDNGGCGAYASCSNNDRAPPTCVDANECLVNNGGCGAYASCNNNDKMAPTCSDINECLVNNGGCGVYYSCGNNDRAPPTCTDIDECATNNGGCGALTCTNNTGAPPSCTSTSDPNECLTNNGGCGAYATCSDTAGAPPTCSDINECLTSNGGCGSLRACSNNDKAPPTCTDIDECATSNGGCGSYATCSNNDNAPPTCTDIDECATSNGGCGDPTFKTCTDNVGAPPTCSCSASGINNGDGLDESGTVRFLYCVALDRPADAGAITFYGDRLRNFETSRAQLLEDLLLSSEFAAQDSDPTARVYRRLLRREPDAGGHAYWATQPLWRMVAIFMGLGEFFTAQPAALFAGCTPQKLARLVDSGVDASRFVGDECIAWAPSGGTVELPAGKYTIVQHLRADLTRAVATGGGRVTVRTAGTGTGRCPYPSSGVCAEFVGYDENTFDYDGDGTGDEGRTVTLGWVPNLTLDRLIFNGDKENAYLRLPARGSILWANTWGEYNADNLVVSRSVIRGHVGGAAFGSAGVVNLTFTDNLVAQNGWHGYTSRASFWSDGATIMGARNSTFTYNTFEDNTDVQLIFGECPGCEVAYNTIRHTGLAQAPRTSAGPPQSVMDGASWAGLAIQSWPDGSTGDYRGATFHHNTIDCGTSARQCGYGILIGNASWGGFPTLADQSKVWAYGATVHSNTVNGAVLGIEIDHASGPPSWIPSSAADVTTVYGNTVTNSGGRFQYCHNNGGSPPCLYLWSEAINVSPASRPYVRGYDGATALDFAHSSMSYFAVLPMHPDQDVLTGATLRNFASTPGAGNLNLENVTDPSTNRPTNNTERVHLLYRFLLGRNADPGGLQWHLDALNAGESISYRAWVTVTNGGSYSGGEFLALHDVNTLPLADLVGVMYQLAFGRSPSPTEVAYWLGQLASISRWDFVYNILFSAELTNRF